jgi:hypothetical protein
MVSAPDRGTNRSRCNRPENHSTPNRGRVAKAHCKDFNGPEGPEEPSEGLRPIRPMPWKIMRIHSNRTLKGC